MCYPIADVDLKCFGGVVLNEDVDDSSIVGINGAMVNGNVMLPC